MSFAACSEYSIAKLAIPRPYKNEPGVVPINGYQANKRGTIEARAIKIDDVTGPHSEHAVFPQNVKTHPQDLVTEAGG